MSQAPKGYTLCTGCREQLVLEVVARRTGGLCEDCIVVNGGPLREIEIAVDGGRIAIPVNGRKKRNHAGKTAESKQRERLIDGCKLRAMRRLKNIFPDLYAILLAEERGAVGLEPWPIQNAVEVGDDPDGQVTADFARLYHALQDRGVQA